MTEPINFNKIKAIRIDEPKMSRLWRVLKNPDSRSRRPKYRRVFTGRIPDRFASVLHHLHHMLVNFHKQLPLTTNEPFMSRFTENQ